MHMEVQEYTCGNDADQATQSFVNTPADPYD
jgi:hypothetical protein